MHNMLASFIAHLVLLSMGQAYMLYNNLGSDCLDCQLPRQPRYYTVIAGAGQPA